MNDAARFLELQPALLRCVHAHRRRYGGDRDELIGEAYLGFVEALRSYQFRASACLETWATLKACLRMHEYRRQLGHAQKSLRAATPACFAPDEPPVACLDGDAGKVVKLAVDPPPDVVITAASIRDAKRPLSLRLGIYEYLRDLGWSAARVAEAFSEVRAAL